VAVCGFDFKERNAFHTNKNRSCTNRLRESKIQFLSLRHCVRKLFVDEAGDDGFSALRSRGKDWFAVGGILEEAYQEGLCNQIRKEICLEIAVSSRRILHFRRFNHEERLGACRILANSGLKGFVSLIRKSDIDACSAPRGRRRLLHERSLAALIESVSRTIGEAALVPDLEIIFSKCERIDYRSVFKSMIAEEEGSKIAVADKQRVARVIIEKPNQRSGLQLADLVVSSCFHGVNVADQQMSAPRYYSTLFPMVELQVISGNKKQVVVPCA
jgi:uncharacterized protein DUF3800